MSSPEVAAAGDEPERLSLRLDGFEGPLDLLLDLARTQKIDLAKISILALVDQYLAIIEGARRVKLEIAGDWLVMAAWLAWLKSRLLLPAEADGKEEGEEAAGQGGEEQPPGQHTGQSRMSAQCCTGGTWRLQIFPHGGGSSDATKNMAKDGFQHRIGRSSTHIHS